MAMDRIQKRIENLLDDSALVERDWETVLDRAQTVPPPPGQLTTSSL